MQYKNIHLIYFSPTHTSAKISYAIAEGLEAETLSESDITCEGLKEPLLIGENELVIVAVPVYGGRVAETAMERIRMFQGKDTPVIPVVVYGNRDYEDALKELSDTLVVQGFIPVSAGAPKRRKFNAISVLSGCCPIAPAMYPDAARTARIPEFVTVPPHFCANPLIEEITPFAENPSFN